MPDHRNTERLHSRNGPSPETDDTVVPESTVVPETGKSEVDTFGDDVKNTSEPAASAVPLEIGGYRIVRKLGEGGMGVVFEAEQDFPKRRVALKVVRGGRYGDQVQLKMFQREIETLGRLKHPNIAAIYDAGHTEEGEHYFTMELVQGETLRDHLDRRPEITTRGELEQRLRLFGKIAEAVRYAHQRGVIHRDLKPLNIIASGDDEDGEEPRAVPEIKVLDFGLARLAESDLAGTVVTKAGAIRGTLGYMSPEQARGASDEIDVRSDVYSLGVILYEMLSGLRPYTFSRRSLMEAVRVICEEPPTPLRKVWSGSIKLDRDLETIVGKALEKDPDLRYSSAGALAADIKRYWTSQPILARPPSTAYQLSKLVSRNKLPFALALTLLLAVVGSAVVTSFQAVRIAGARDEAEAVTAFLSDMLAAVDPEEQGRDVSVRQVLDRAAEEIDTQFGDQPLIRARLRLTMGNTYEALGVPDAAAEQLERALAVRAEILGEESPETMTVEYDLSGVYTGQGRYDEATELYGELLEKRRRVLGEEHPDTLSTARNLSGLHRRAGRYEDAERLLQEVLDVQQRTLGEDDGALTDTLLAFGNMYADMGRSEEAQDYLRRVLESRRRTLGEDHPRTLSAMENLAIVYADMGDLATTESLLNEVFTIRRELYGHEHPRTVHTLTSLAGVISSRGRHQEALPLLEEGLAVARGIWGVDHEVTLTFLNNLGYALRKLGRYEEAERFHIETLQGRRRLFGSEHLRTFTSMNNLAQLYVDTGRYADAEALHRQTLDLRRKVLGGDHPHTLISMHNLALVYERQRRLEDAESMFRETLEARRAALGEDHPRTLSTMSGLAATMTTRGKYREAEELLLAAVTKLETTQGSEDARTIEAIERLAELYGAWGRPDEESALRSRLRTAEP